MTHKRTLDTGQNTHNAKKRPSSGRPVSSKNADSLKETVYFVGFMGAGKSTVARKLARRLGVAALDMDKYIERAQGHSIKQIFDDIGEVGFRQIEHETLEELSHSEQPLLVSCGGGVVMDPKNREILKSSGKVVHLLVDADEAAERISDKSSRPLFNDMESARELCRSRLPLYEEVADITVMTGSRGVNSIAGEVARRLREEGALD